MSEPTITIPKAEFDRLLDAFRSRIVELEQRIVELETKIRFLKNGRDSGTSSTPPSQDLGRSNAHSLREKSGKPLGGQKGHRGVNLALSPSPDEVVSLAPTHCRDCGAELTAVTGELQARRHLPCRLPVACLPPACRQAGQAGQTWPAGRGASFGHRHATQAGVKLLCRALDDTRRQTIPDGDMLNSYKNTPPHFLNSKL